MLKCTEFNFRWGFAPHLTVRAYSAPRPTNCIYWSLFLKAKKGSGWQYKGVGKKGYERGRIGEMLPPIGDSEFGSG